jgi:hypothetical protein
MAPDIHSSGAHTVICREGRRSQACSDLPAGQKLSSLFSYIYVYVYNV